MSIRLDPRRVTVLKRLAAETGMRPGDLVRQWVEERLDAARQGIDTPQAATQLTAQLADLVERVAALETAAGVTAPSRTDAHPVAQEAAADAAQDDEGEDAPAAAAQGPEPEPEPEPERAAEEDAVVEAVPRKRSKRVVSSPAGPRVALHDEMIAVLAERGPMPAAELAAAVAERGRYQPPRSGKPLDAAMISQRVSNPVYRSRFTRNEGRIGIAEPAE